METTEYTPQKRQWRPLSSSLRQHLIDLGLLKPAPDNYQPPEHFYTEDAAAKPAPLRSDYTAPMRRPQRRHV